MNPCTEGTHDCFEKNFEECVFVDDGKFRCQNCRPGYEVGKDASKCTGQFQRMFKVLPVVHRVKDWYLNFNRCSSEQQPLKTVGKTEF